MSDKPFYEVLTNRADRGLSVCVGLDSEFERLPSLVRSANDPQLEFNARIIDATADLVVAYKPNSAFYEARGSAGIDVLVATVQYIRAVAPDVPVILDAKRGDIGSTNDGYATFAFDLVGADAVTLHPFLGAESAGALLSDARHGVFILCRTSNPGAGEFQDLATDYMGESIPLYEAVAHSVRDRWNENDNCGLVVGATYPEELGRIRAIAPDLPLLIPGIGAQGGDLPATLAALRRVDNGAPWIINSSRQIIFASSDSDFAEAGRTALVDLDEAIRQLRK